MEYEIGVEKMHQLLELNDFLDSNRDFVDKISHISKTIKDVVHADRCTIFVHDPHSRSFWSAHIDGLSYIEVPEDKGIVSRVFHDQKEMIVNNVREEKSFYSNVDKTTGYFTHSMIAMPILGFGDQSIGVVQLINKTDGTIFNEEDSAVLHYVLGHIASFVEFISHHH